jgi:hypothetical protein
MEPTSMPKIEGTTYSADVEWDKEGKPVLFVTGGGRVKTPKQALDVVEMAVRMTNESKHDHVCAVYNLLEIAQVPFLGRFINSGRFPSTTRTAHIILATNNPALRLIGSLAAVATSKRLRTFEVCTTPDEIDAAVKRWLSLPDRTREYNIHNV